MTEDFTEQLLRVALKETARNIEALPPTRGFEVAQAAHVRRRHHPVLAAAMAAAVIVLGLGAVVAVVFLRGDSTPSSVRGQSPSKEVSLESLPDADTDLEAAMRVEATPAEIDGVREALLASPAVRSFAYVDRNAALRILRSRTSCNPSFADPFTPDVLPPSFRIVTTGQIGSDELRASLAATSGVDSVLTPERRQAIQDQQVCGSHAGPTDAVALTEGSHNGVEWTLLGAIDHGNVNVDWEVAGRRAAGLTGSLKTDEVIAAGPGGGDRAVGPVGFGFTRKETVTVRIVVPNAEDFDVPVVGQGAGFDVNFFVAFLPADFEEGHDAFEAVALDAAGQELGRTIG